nr:immunoglobulin heavy chain junction region [Mus musculus]MBK4196705.1 immunoglobulin heavy chain junction region [Mus musculus]MBK4196706.1 immunoglobulin heavy chain junction region [Mus musculus]MBK4196707.1 immunoglobulin heavy chain junction region [Mus musculus]MBK4196708.1 immunoglobulin heavy chain junction region [Mus musculus]
CARRFYYDYAFDYW